ncbi:hypothetical protein NQ117_13095 [Paenibacillus sp. SC116]|uniref:AlkZ-related protein n=1 Tax=Paenibacillus sp. SC116 TaxID=2968986 RepID=UPI00215A7F9C|nr:hypothetical protein [Paenibacillus sp. SC116]MCR8844620.1 hypothetical protein [Paenibacillus sp. SC116]
MNRERICTYDEAVEVIREVGILPLAKLIPNHPSLDVITPSEQWHTDADNDPWRWRVRFPSDGSAAYGKFLKKKSVLVSADLVSALKTLIGSEHSVEERYEDGQLSREAKELYTIIEANPGIETRSLRAEAGMKAQDKKKDFDRSLLELQSTMDIVISGVKEERNEDGELKGWRNTSFETLGDWMRGIGLAEEQLTRDEARTRLEERLFSVCTPEAIKAFRKALGL